MSSDESARADVSVDLSEDVRDWLGDRSADDGESPADVARRLLVAHYDLANSDATPADTLASHEDGVSEADLEDALADLDAEFRDLLDDVRKRVVQVKRETDQKAPDDHDHPHVEGRLDDLAADITDVAAQIETLDDAVDDVDDRLDAGFENYEDILEYLTDETGALRDRIDTLARAVIELRSEFQALAAERARRESVRELKRAASQYGVRTADCAACETTVDIAMLTTPECPHCASQFTDVSPGTRFLKPDVLETGDPPALTGGGETDLDAELEEIVDDDRDVPNELELSSTDDGDER
jgi:cell division protein FtsB